MAINQGLLRNDFSYRAPYGSNRRQPSYNNPTRGAAKASAPASTGSLESRSVVRGPGIENDEMDASDDADMVTQTQTPLTANARGPRYTEGSMMDLFTGQRTGTKNADYKADQPITDTNTPYLATKGFWGGIDRVLGNKSNELNEAAQQQQGANWNTANKLKDAQNREDTITNNANTFIRERDTAKVTADTNAATALEKAQATAAGALAGVNTLRDAALAGYASARDTAKVTADTETARIAQTNAVLNATTQNGFNIEAAKLLASAKTQEQKDKALSDIAILSAQNGFNVEAAKIKVAADAAAAGNIIHETPDGNYTQGGKLYTKNEAGKFVHVPLGAPPRSAPPKSNLNNVVPQAGQGSQVDQDQPTSQAQPNGQVSLASKPSKSSPAYLSSDSSPSQNKSLDLNYFNLGNQAPRGLTIKDMQSRFSEANPNAQSPEGLGRERSSRRTSEQLGLDYSEANPNAQSSEGLSAESFQDQLRRSQEPLEESLRFPEGFDFKAPYVNPAVNPEIPELSQDNNPVLPSRSYPSYYEKTRPSYNDRSLLSPGKEFYNSKYRDQFRKYGQTLEESLKFPEGFDFNSQDTNPKTPASSQVNNSESLMRSLGSGVLRAGASVPKFLQDVHNLRIAEPHSDTMSGYSVTRDGRRIEPPEIIQDSIRLGNRRAPEIMQSPEGQYEESAMLEDQYDPRTVIPKEINGRKRTLNDEEQIRIDDEMLRRAKNSRKPSFITK